MHCFIRPRRCAGGVRLRSGGRGSLLHSVPFYVCYLGLSYGILQVYGESHSTFFECLVLGIPALRTASPINYLSKNS